MIRLEIHTNPLLEGWLALNRGLPANDRFAWMDHKPTRSQVELAVRLLELEGSEEVAKMLADDDHLLGLVAPHTIRRQAVKRWAWAIPSPDALQLVARHSPLVEIGAGTGYWAALLAQRGADVVAYDQYPPDLMENFFHNCEGPDTFFPVTQAGVEMAGRHPERTLLLIWPPYAPDHHTRLSEPEDPEGWERTDYELNGKTHSTWTRPNADPDIGFLALETYAAAGGQRVIYVGEGPGGCTAGDAFHARVFGSCSHWGDEPCECPPRGWVEVEELSIPQWFGLHDHLWVFERA